MIKWFCDSRYILAVQRSVWFVGSEWTPKFNCCLMILSVWTEILYMNAKCIWRAQPCNYHMFFCLSALEIHKEIKAPRLIYPIKSCVIEETGTSRMWHTWDIPVPNGGALLKFPINGGSIFKVGLKVGCFWWYNMDCEETLVVKVGKTTAPRVTAFGFFDMDFLSGLGSWVFLCDRSWLACVNVLSQWLHL